jgi:hypothetical protein
MTDLRDYNVQNIIGYLILASLGIWVASIQSTINDVIALKPQITRIQSDVKANRDWQKDWVTNGRLPADVEQDKDIEMLDMRVDNIEELDLENRLATIEVLLTQIHKQLVQE